MLSLLVLSPCFGFLLLSFWHLGWIRLGKKISSKSSGILASTAIGISFLASLSLLWKLLSLPISHRVIEKTLFSWIETGGFSLSFHFVADPLSVLFSLVISGVGFLIHVYSIGYMQEDETPAKYFAFLNLFCFAMLVLVLGSSLPVLFLGWEGVGLCSYLLIGYWYQDMEKSIAGQKAFILNRIGDFGFLIGMFILFSLFGTLEFSSLKTLLSEPQMIEIHHGALVLASLFLFLGCTGKSAQIPLYVWLPDAMAGPTPVSALIHAATMVTSGVYLLARMSFLYGTLPEVLNVIAWVGGVTAFVAATIAITQTDIKKVLAYSTISQLGYMFLACGVGAFSVGVFHVVTHAFFKALLFLGAGSIIVSLHHEQNLEKMGGLRKILPYTFGVYVCAWLAICGIPPFAGFFSKDEILWSVFQQATSGAYVLWFLGWGTAVLTAIYMTRLMMLAFYGKPRMHHPEHVQEAPKVMRYPLYVLAALSVVGGFLGMPHGSWVHHWLDYTVSVEGSEVASAHASLGLELFMMFLSVFGAVLGIWLGFRWYRDLSLPKRWKQKWSAAYTFLWNKWYIDDFYKMFFGGGLWKLSKVCAVWVDPGGIDRSVLGFGKSALRLGKFFRWFHRGNIQGYLVFFLLGMTVFLGCVVYGLG